MSELAFDLRSYQHLIFKVAEGNVVDDLSALVLEASTNHPRVVYWETTPDKILNGLDPADPSSQTTLHIHDLMLATEGKHAIIWVSPPSNKYPEARINLYLSDDCGPYKNFSVSAKYTIEECSTIVAGLHRVGTTANTLALVPIPEEIASIDYLRPYIPLPEDLWEDILSGKAKIRREQVTGVARTIAPALIFALQSGANYLHAGAMAELYMASFGFGMQTRGSGCGLSNLETWSRFEPHTITGLPKFEASTPTCVEIECQVCHWKPNSEQLKQIENKTLTHCPKCEPES